MYHCFAMVTSLPSPCDLEDPVHHPEEERDDDPQEQAEDDDRHDHDGRCPLHLLARRPGRALELPPDLQKECAGPLEPVHAPCLHARPQVPVLAGQEGFEPPTSGFGDRRSSRSSYWPAPGPRPGTSSRLLRFLVRGMSPAPSAELLELQLLRRLFAVLRRDV